MKKTPLIASLLLFSGCVSHFESPLTHAEYKGEISENGIGITAKPPGWDIIIYCWEYITSD